MDYGEMGSRLPAETEAALRSTALRPNLGPTQQLPTSSAEVKNEQSYNSTPPYVIMA
jgi:hypothetical protein